MRGLLHVAFVLSVFLLVPSTAQRKTTSESSGKGLHPSAKFKSVELEGKYTIQVPDDFTVKRIAVSAAAAYAFVAPSPQYTTIQVVVLPRVGITVTDEKTGKFPLPFQCEGGVPESTDYFEIAGSRTVYYGWSVTDNAYECSMNSPCPWPAPPKSRYTTEYVFAVPDDRYCVEFTAMHVGASKNVTGFQGEGKLLRDVIVPSLSPRH